jgi:hypothetical protein
MTNLEIVAAAENILNDTERREHLSYDDIGILSAATGIARILLREKNDMKTERAVLEKISGEKADFYEEWAARKDSVVINAPAALQASYAKGYCAAVKDLLKTTEGK